MKVLFLSRAKKDGNPSPVIQAQFNSLKDHTDLSLFIIKGKGWKAYIQNIVKLRNYLKKNPVDIIHAHYSYVAMVASLASRTPIVVSLMGSDIEDYWIGRVLIRIFAKLSWNEIIVKSQRSKDHINLKSVKIIPNGLNMKKFIPHPYETSRIKVGFENDKKYVLFLAHPDRYEKNFKLATSACELLQQKFNIQLISLDITPQDQIPVYLAAADSLILTSLFEGSPNAVKEAMACNCPIVTTDVGDVRQIIGNTEGCYITSFDPEDVAGKLEKALNFGKRTNGRDYIGAYDDKIISQRLIEVYNSVLK